MATVTQTFRPIKIGKVTSTDTYSNPQNAMDADANTYMSDTLSSTKLHYVLFNYDLSGIPSNATVTGVTFDLVWLMNITSSSNTILTFSNITNWTSAPSSTTVGVCTRSSWGVQSGRQITKSTTKTTYTVTGAQIQNNNRDFLSDVNGMYRSTFLCDSIALQLYVAKSSTSANIYYYDLPLTITYTIPTSTITVNAGTGGTATGGGEYTNGTQITITATPNTGYHFVQWNDGNTSASRTITVNGDATYTASFAINQYTISTAVSPSGSGSVTGGGTYNYGSTVTLTAVPATGYAFVKWQDNNSSTNPRSFTAYANGSYTAIFERSVIEPAITDISFNPARVQASQYSIITVTMEQI